MDRCKLGDFDRVDCRCGAISFLLLRVAAGHVALLTGAAFRIRRLAGELMRHAHHDAA